MIRSIAPVADFLYLIAHQNALPARRLAAFRSSFALLALAMVAAVVAQATLLAVWVIATITRPLRQLSQAVAAISNCCTTCVRRVPPPQRAWKLWRCAGALTQPSGRPPVGGIALRITRNAARLVQSIGDLAQLHEPGFRPQPEAYDTAELLDDIALCFAARAAQ